MDLNRDISCVRENIINTMVNQEVTCYDLQCEIQILEVQNKFQKEKMVIIQTESVALSGRLDDEIRNRAETINIVNNNCKLTDFLERMIVELRETLSRCRSDNKALSLALEKCTQEGKAIKEELKKQEQQAKDTISILEQKLQYQTESEKKMLEGFNSQKGFLEGQKEAYKEVLLRSQNTIMDLLKQNFELKTQLTQKIICEKNGEILNLKKKCENTAQPFVEMKILLDESKRLANKESDNAVVKVVEEKTASIESPQAESALRKRKLNCQIDREMAQAKHAHSLTHCAHAQKEKP